MTTPKALYINGEWISGYGKPLVSHDPYNKQVVWEAASASNSDVGRAIQAGKKAFGRWSGKSVEERFTFIEKYKKILEQEKKRLATAISQETGKPLWDSASEVSAMIGKVSISLQAYKERCREYRKEEKEYHSYTLHRPYGVVGILGPFNFPGHLPNGHIIPALIAGNTVVLKPSELTPLSSEIMIQCWDQAEIPPGVVNLVQGKREAGKALSTHKDLAGLFFTGSYSTGKVLTEQFAKTPEKILALEMGGNNPLVITSVQDKNAAVYHTIQSVFLSAGQRCTCARRLILLAGSESDQFLENLINQTNKLRIGHYSDKEEPFMGPVVSESAVVKALTAQAILQAKGGKILKALEHLEEGTGRVTPGIIDVTKVSEKEDEEIFAPFLQVIRVKTFEEAIEEANNTQYGLAAALFSDHPQEWEVFSSAIRAGIINWNRPTTGALSSAPFGGIGHSGNHRPSAFYAADYCAYPTSSMTSARLTIPPTLSPGFD